MKITELLVSRECPQDAIDRALEQLVSMSPSRSGNFVQVYKTVEGSLSHSVTTGAACHARLGNPVPPNQKREVIGFCHNNGTDHILPFYDWFIHRSFASGFVVGENSRGFVVDCDIPPELLQNIGIISRHGWELSSVPFEMFDYIVSKGYREETAYVCALNSGVGLRSVPLEDILKHAVGDGMGSHRAWRLFPLNSLKLFLEGDFGEKLSEFAKEPSARTRATITGGISLCDAGPNLSDYRTTIPDNFVKELMTSPEREDFRKLLSEFRTGSGEPYRPPNPFVAQPSRIPSTSMSFNELISVALPYLKTKGFPV